MKTRQCISSAHRGSVFFRSLLAIAAFAGASVSLPLAAQEARPTAPQSAPQPSATPVPDSLELAKLVWSTVIAVDQANKSGNYSVLRDMSAQGFQVNNNPAKLATIFANLRSSGIDLSNVLLVPPTYSEQPRMVQAGMIEVKGAFNMRPNAVRFQMLFQWEQGRWKLFGVDIRPVPTAASQ